MPKVLIVSYYWPPAGGPGVQRVLKFAKYLPDLGWETIILTVKNGNFPAIDESLIDDIPSGIKVYKTSILEPFELYKKFSGIKKADKIPVAVLAGENLTGKQRVMHWIRSNMFIPDAKIGWFGYGVKAGMEIIRKEKPDLIMSSSPPPTVHLIAGKLAKQSRLPWLADFRDPWTGIHYYRKLNRNKFAAKKDENLERSVLKHADVVLSASTAFANLLKLPEAKKSEVLTNGFDGELVNIQDRVRPDKFEILYIGGLTTNRFYQQFFESFAKLLQKNEQFSRFASITIAGSVNQEILAKISEIIPLENFKFLGYLPHYKAEELMHKSALNLLLMEKTSNYAGHIPGKIFEYLAAGTAILGIGDPEGDSSRILETSGLGKMFEQDSNWEDVLQDYFKSWLNSEILIPNLDYINQFHRKKLCEKLKEIFNRML